MKVRRKTLQGLETEFGFSALDSKGRRCDVRALEAILAQVRSRIPVMASEGNGFFLANGGLLYVDTGNHLEWSTPECTCPREVVRFQYAGERLIADVARRVEAAGDFSEIRIFKTNVCYSDLGSSFGSHESLLYRNFAPDLSRQLLPFLASRIVFTGAGGLRSGRNGIEFTLAPRVGHLERESSGGTTNTRGIFNTKNESLSDSIYRRAHLICGESNCSQFQTWLRIGTTALVVAMTDAGLLPGDAVQLQNALESMRHYASDMTCRAPHKNARQPRGISALDIQYHYLALAEKHINCLFMPGWAEQVCTAWRQTLDTLAQDPMALADRLDWPLKWRLMCARMEKRLKGGLAEVSLWNSVLSDIENALIEEERRALFPLSHARIRSHGRKQNRLGAAIRAGTQRLAAKKIRWRQLDDFMRLRWELCEFDMAFGEISQRGIHSALDAAGVLNHRLWSDEECAAAITGSPSAGRARIRADQIKRLADDKVSRKVCSWAGIITGKLHLNLSDPFAHLASWIDYSGSSEFRGPAAELPAFLRRRTDRRRRDL